MDSRVRGSYAVQDVCSGAIAQVIIIREGSSGWSGECGGICIGSRRRRSMDRGRDAWKDQGGKKGKDWGMVKVPRSVRCGGKGGGLGDFKGKLPAADRRAGAIEAAA